MSRPGLLRRAAAATLGASVRAIQPTTLTVPVELGLARRAAAAVIGIRSYRLLDNSPSASRAFEVRRPAAATSYQSLLTAPPPQAETPTEAGPRQNHLRPDPPDWDTFVLDSAAPVMLGSSTTRAEQRQRGPRRALALAAVAAVLAIAFTAFGYQLRPFIHQQFPAHPAQSEAPTPTPTPTPVLNGDVPQAYLGSWRATITNTDGKNTRTLVIKQGRVGDDVLTVVADGPTSSGNYHCVFTSSLTAVSSDGSQLTVGPSAVTSSDSGYCKPGDATKLTIKADGSLRRTNLQNDESLIYTR